MGDPEFPQGLKPHIFPIRALARLKLRPFKTLSQCGVFQTSAALPNAPRGRRSRQGEEGFILLAVIFFTLMVLIALAVAAPKMAADIQRDRELETVHRGKQYVRAIKMYYKKFGAYPPTLDALMKSNDIRFLRKRYKDPMTGKDDWKLIHFGENKTPSYGFFGQPISGAGGATIAGVGPQGNTGSGGLFSGNGASGTGSSGSIFGSDSSAQAGTQAPAPTPTDPNAGASTDPNAGTTGATGANGANGANGAGAGTNSGGGLFSNSGFGSSNNASPLTIGGLGIIGVESTSPKLGILEWKKKKHYNEWEFWYDPNADRMMIGASSGPVGQPAGGSSGFGNPSGGVNTPGSSPSGLSGQPGQPAQPSQPSQPVQPTQPQQ
jgi:type II secretory pathway pseudopilin PulG